MLVNFWCRHCRISTSVIASIARCPRCGTGMPLEYYYPGIAKMGKNTGSINQIQKTAPIYGVGTNFALDKRNSGTRLNSPGKNR